VVFAFSVGLGVATLAIPLLALGAGFGAATVGFLVATAAATQFLTRLALPILLGRFPDRTLIALSSVLMLVGFSLLAVDIALPVFVLAQVLQGAARAIFWTASQTHAIRGESRPVQRLVDVNVAGNAGTLIGPVLAGSLASFGLQVAMAAAVAGAALAVMGTPLMRRLPPFDRQLSGGSMSLLRRDGVDVACWASAAGGVWWSMVGSYIPVILVSSGLGPAAIGWLITASETAGTVALLSLRNVATRWVPTAVRIGAFGALTALAAVAVAALLMICPTFGTTDSPPPIVVYAVLLVLGGAASGTVTTMAPAMATLMSEPDEQGDALSLSGTFRAGALFGAPATVGGLLSVMALVPALLVVVAAAAGPGLIIGRRRRR